MINKSRFSYKVFFTVFSTFFIFSSSGGWISYSLLHSIITQRVDENLITAVNGIRQMVETSAELSAKNYLRSLAEHFWEAAHSVDLPNNPDDLLNENSKKDILRHLSNVKVGNSGYAYVINSQGKVILHPDKNIIGKNISNYKFIQKQIEFQSGYIEYEWQNRGERTARQKVSYMEYYKPWDWIISITAYTDELSLLVKPSDFRELVLSVDIGENGYPFIISKSGVILVHPTFTGNVSQLPDINKEVLEEMITTGKGKMYYDLFEEESNEITKKIAIYETIDSYDWIVAGTGYVEDFYHPLKSLRNLFIVLIIFGFCVSVLISFYLSRSITSPINNLLKKLSLESTQFNFKHNPSDNKNEIEELTSYFYEYIQDIKVKNEKLHKLITKQTKTVNQLNVFKEVFDNTAEGISITDTNGIIKIINPAFERITGYSQAEAIGQNPNILKSGKHSSGFYHHMWSDIRKYGFWSGEIWNKRKNGEVYPEWLTISAVRNSAGKTYSYAAVFKDITEIVKQKEKISFLAYHDHLTELPNRLLIAERIRQSIAECSRKQRKLYCLVWDVDNFKTINDSLGQEKGDKFLNLFVERVRPALRLEDVFGRIGGDEFALIVKEESKGLTQINFLIERIFYLLHDPFQVEEHSIYITLSLGVSCYPSDSENDDGLLSNAILALSNAKKSKGNSFSFYNLNMGKEVNKKIQYLSKMKKGLLQKEFIPYYQPKISLLSGKFVGMEALARWKSGDNLVSPADFIPLAEESGMILEMSWQLYNRAFSDCLQLVRDGIPAHLSINISPQQLQVESFLEELLLVQHTSGLEKQYIDLEITESALHKNIDYVQGLLRELKNAGFSLSIDDFGTGYSSLQYLKELPFNTLKIDMSFISGIGVDFDDEQVVKTITMLAKQFGMTIVAEGIENAEQIEFLKLIGCDLGQGYFYGRPMPFDELIEWISENN